MSTKELRPEVSSGVTSVIFGLVVLALFGWCYHWYDTTNKKVDALHAARQEEAIRKESERNDADNALARDVQRHQKPTWSGLLDPHDMSPWVSVPAGYGWSFDADGDVDVKVHYRNRRDGSYGAETFPHNQPDKLIHIDTDKLKLENLGETAQRVKLWVYQYGDNTARIKMPGGEILTFGAPTKPQVEHDHESNTRESSAHQQASVVDSSKDADFPEGTSPLEEAPAAPKARVISNEPPRRRIDLTLECGDRQLAMPEPHESPDYSNGLYGVTLKVPVGCWSEWLVVPQGYTPYVIDLAGFAQARYEIYPAHNGNAEIAWSQPGRTTFSKEERAGFQSIRFSGYAMSAADNILKLLFTKP